MNTPTNQRPTPETDAEHKRTIHSDIVIAFNDMTDFARRLEQQRDALREALEKLVDCITETRGKNADDALLVARAILAETDPNK